MPLKQDIIIELTEIFPQHSEDTIEHIYDNVLLNFAYEDHWRHMQIKDIILTSCIERLVEMPDGITKENNSFMSNQANGNNINKNFNSDLYNIGSNRDLAVFQKSSDCSSKNPDKTFYRDKNYSKSSLTVQSNNPVHSTSGNNVEVLNSSSNNKDLHYMKDEVNSLVIKINTSVNTCLINKEDRKRKIETEEDSINQTITPKKSYLNEVNGVSSTLNILPIIQQVVSPSLPGKNLLPEPLNLDITLLKGMIGFVEHTKKAIISVIKDVEETFLERLINSLPHEITLENAVNYILHHLLDLKIYPKCDKNKPEKQPTRLSQDNSSPSACTTSSTSEYKRQSILVLQNMFVLISTAAIRSIFYGVGKSNFTLAYNFILCEIKNIKEGKKNVSESMFRSFLKNKRKSILLTLNIHPQLEKEMPSLNMNLLESSISPIQSNLISNQNNEEYQTVECSCCYNDAKFEEMIQCQEGHLFCQNCLKQYSNEAVYGAGKLQLFCMADSCSSSFPLSQLQKVLTQKELEKYHERVQEEDIKLANINNLVRCPDCEFAAEMPDGDKVFKCQNETCMKETCRYCKVDWEDHFGKPCKEVENKSETSLRTSYEEKMTLAKVRKCWKCETTFLKTDGCNKMTCRCGSRMCYICREPKIDYGHFCQHAREPGQKCTQCTKCSLWTDPTEDDDRAVFEIKQEAEKERIKLTGCNSHISKITVGPSIEVKALPNVMSQPVLPIVPNNIQQVYNHHYHHRRHRRHHRNQGWRQNHHNN